MRAVSPIELAKVKRVPGGFRHPALVSVHPTREAAVRAFLDAVDAAPDEELGPRGRRPRSLSRIHPDAIGPAEAL